MSNAEERKRTRVLSRDEEKRLLAACNDQRRAHLRPLIICGIDTGMRMGEMLKLRWRDVDLGNRIITIIAFNTKTAEERPVPITNRLALELEKLWSHSLKDPDSLVFGITNRVKRGWGTACRLAGVENATPHDMRHTAATRWIQQGMELSEVSRLLGHANVNTTYRYVNRTPETLTRAADAFNRFHDG